MYLTFCSILLAVSIAACGVAEVPPPTNAPSVILPPSTSQDADTLAEDMAGAQQFELTTAQGETILFSLNNGDAAKSFYEQLPLSLSIEAYGEYEKIFYPPEKLDTRDTPLAKGPAGTLAYYAPWGNVAIYSGDCGGASDLYQLGQVVSGSEYLSQLSGIVQLAAVSGNVSSPAPKPQESTNPSETPLPPSVQPPSQNVTAVPPAPKPPVQTPPRAMPVAPPAQKETPPDSMPPEQTPEVLEPSVPEEKVINNIKITVGNKSFTATLEDNNATKDFVRLLQNAPIVMQMSDYSGFEKVGSLGTSLPESNRQMTAQVGDIILYNGNQICVFYGSNSWRYTKLGEIDDISGWAEALGEGDVTVTFSIT